MVADCLVELVKLLWAGNAFRDVPYNQFINGVEREVAGKVTPLYTLDDERTSVEIQLDVTPSSTLPPAFIKID